MPGNYANVSFTSPAAMVDPNLIVSQQQIARNQQLADALRQQSMGEVKAGSGRVSWTQGAAKLAEALAAKKLYKKADDQSLTAAQQYGNALSGMFGGRKAPQRFGDGTTVNGAMSLSGGEAAPLQLPATGQSIDIPQAAPEPQAPEAAQAPEQGPMSLTGDPARDQSMYMMNPEEYTKAVIAKGAPSDFTKMLGQAGIDPNSPIGRQLIQANIAKQNYVPPVTGRPGAIQRDPFTNAIIGVDPQNIEGANPVIENGQFTGRYSPAEGAAGVVQQMAGAKAFGQAAGDMIQRYNPQTQQMEFVPKQAALQAGPMAAGPALGAPAAADVTAKNSANDFKVISDGAADVPNRLYALKQMSDLANDPKSILGPGSDTSARLQGTLATFANSVGISAPSPASVSNFQEFSKWSSQYSARSAQELGLSGSDKRTELAIHATPNGDMTKEALKGVIPQMVGIENAKQGYANAAVAWQRSHGAADVQSFRAQWNKVYDPRIYTAMAQGPVAVKALLKNASPAERQALIAKSQALAGIGALPQ